MAMCSQYIIVRRVGLQILLLLLLFTIVVYHCCLPLLMVVVLVVSSVVALVLVLGFVLWVTVLVGTGPGRSRPLASTGAGVQNRSFLKGSY